MARKKAKAKVKEEAETIILDGNVKTETPELKVRKPETETAPEKKGPVRVIQVQDEKPADTITEDMKKLRPEGVYGPDEETAAEMGDRLQKIADDYKIELEKENSKEKLEELEKEWIEKLDQLDEYLRQVTYRMPKTVAFDNKKYFKPAIYGKMVRFIQKKEVKFQFTLGMFEMCRLLSSNPDELTYSQYNGVLETLGSMSFKGMGEWEDILVINEFFRATNKEYAKDLTAYQYLSTMHSQLVSRIQIIEPVAQK